MSAPRKEARLVELLAAYRGALIAFSGGVDSSYLAFTAHRVLGKAAVAVTALSPAVSGRQRALATEFVARFRLRHRFVETSEMGDDNYTSNPPNRCYFCKSELYDRLERLRSKLGLEVVLDGTNHDDIGDHRPGRQAAREQGVVSPLQEVALTKAEIRSLSRRWELPCWNLPAAPCLSSRFPYGVRITEDKLARVEKAEDLLRQLGFREFRVRHFEETARLEISRPEMHLLDREGVRGRLEADLQALGYRRVMVDPRGFRSGALNEALRASGPESVQPQKR